MKTVTRGDLEELLAAQTGEHLFLSAFLSTSIEEKNKRETEIFIKQKIRQFEKVYSGAQLDEFRRCAARLRKFLDDEIGERTRGAAVFVSAAGEFFKSYEFSIRLPNRFVVDSGPVIGPLAEILENNTHHGIVLLDKKHGRILSCYLWRVVDEKSLTDEDVPAKTKVGGWSQMRFQRHHHEVVHHFLKDLADALGEFVARQNPDDLVLLGQDRTVAEFMKLLPPAVRAKVILTENMDIGTSSQDVVRRLRPIIEAEIDKTRADLLHRLENQIRQDHLAVGGLDDTLQRLLEGRVDQLVVTKGIEHGGWSCGGCGYLFSQPQGDACPFCKGALADVELVERMVEIAEKHRTPVEFINSGSDDFISQWMDGVGAFLKY